MGIGPVWEINSLSPSISFLTAFVSDTGNSSQKCFSCVISRPSSLRSEGTSIVKHVDNFSFQPPSQHFCSGSILNRDGVIRRSRH